MTISTLVMMRSSIVGFPTHPIEYPSVTEQLRSLIFLKTDDTICPAQPNHTTPGAEEGWRWIGDQYIWFHTKKAANFARFLEAFRKGRAILEWKYLSRAFPIDGIRGGYTPEFEISHYDGTTVWVETRDVDGEFDLLEQTICFGLEYPDETLNIVEDDWFEENAERFKKHIPGWEG